MFFISWLHFLLAEKSLDLEDSFSIVDSRGAKITMTYSVVVEAICLGSAKEQESVKTKLIQLDNSDYDIKPFFQSLAKAIVQ